MDTGTVRATLGVGLLLVCGTFAFMIWMVFKDRAAPKTVRPILWVSIVLFAITLITVSSLVLPQVQVITKLSGGEDSADDTTAPNSAPQTPHK